MALDRKDIRDAIQALFRADATLLALIDSGNMVVKEVEFLEAKVSNPKKVVLYITANNRETIQNRSQNSDYQIVLPYRLVGKFDDPQTAKDTIDNIETRMEFLIHNEMWTGNMLTSDANSIVYNMTWDVGEAEIREADGNIVIESEGQMTVLINRQKI